jgi:hypothetical protein
MKKGIKALILQLRVNFSEDLKPITKEMYDLLHARLLQAVK